MYKFKKNIKLLLLVVALFTTLFLSYNFYSLSNSFELLSKIFINNTISNVAERCDTWLTNKINLANGLVGYIKIQKTSEIFKYQDYFINAVDAYKFMDITVGFEDGTVAAGMPEGLPIGYDHRVRSWYINAMKANAPYISAPYVDATTGFPCITVCVPIKIENTTAGIFSFDLDFSGLDNILFDTVHSVSGEYPILITSDGEIIIHERKDFTLKKITDLSPEYANILNFVKNPANNGKYFKFNDGQIDKFILFKKLNYNNWYILYELPTAIVDGPGSNIKILTVILTMIASVAIIIIFLFYAKKDS